MRKVIEVLHTEHKTSKAGEDYTVTYVLLDDGTEARAFGELKVGDEVQVWHNPDFDRIECQRIP